MTGRFNHNCNNCDDSINRIIDGNCSQQERNALLADVKGCPRCFDQYERRKKLKTFIHDKYPKKNVNPNILNSIREGINNIR